MKKVFLGGTCNKSKWRDELIKMLEIILQVWKVWLIF